MQRKPSNPSKAQSLDHETRRLFVMPFRPQSAQQRSWFWKDEASQLVELALVTPLLMLILAGTVDFGRAYFVNMEVSAAAEAGAMYGIQNTSDTAGMKTAALLNAPDLPNLTPTAISGTECADGSTPTGTPATCVSTVVQYVEVDTTATYTPILYYPGIQSLFTMTSKSRMRASY